MYVTEGCVHLMCKESHVHVYAERVLRIQEGLESGVELAIVPPSTFPCPLAPSAVFMRSPDTEQLPRTHARGVGVQQRRLRGPGVSVEPAR